MTELAKIHQTGSFDLATPPDEAIHLFTAPGEEHWVPGWVPRILSGDGTERGTVFLTGEGDSAAVWIVIEYDTNAYHARYARVASQSHAGTVDVQLQANETGGSTVTVTYALTALCEAGVEALKGFDDDSYSKMMSEWKELIEAADIDYRAIATR